MRAIAISLVLLATAQADFSDDQVPVTPDILRRVIAAAESYGLKSTGDQQSAYYLRSASYIGECRSTFGSVHLASLTFTRSSLRGSKNPARGHSFIVFLDDSLKVRARWKVDFDTEALSIRDGSKIYFGEEAVVDYLHPPPARQGPGEDAPSIHLAIDGQPFSLPTWHSSH